MKIFKLIKLDFKRYLANKEKIAIIIFLPIVLTVITVAFLYFANGNKFTRFSVGVLNNDNSEDMGRLIDLFENTESVQQNMDIIYCMDKKEVENQLKNDKIIMGVVIPKNFISNLYDNKRNELIIYEKNNGPENVQSFIFKKVIADLVDLGEYSQKSLDVLWYGIDQLKIEDTEKQQIYYNNAKMILLNIVGRNNMFNIKTNYTVFIYYFISFFVLCIYISAIYFYYNINFDEDSNMIDRLIINNFKYEQYLLSKFFVTFTIQITINSIILGTFMMYFNVDIIRIIYGIFLVTLCSNLFIWLLINLFKNKFILIIIFLTSLMCMVIYKNNSCINLINRSVQLLLNELNKYKEGNFNNMLWSIGILLGLNSIVFIINKSKVLKRNLVK